MSFYQNFLIENRVPSFTGYDAIRWNIAVESEIISSWKWHHLRNKVILVVTLGLGYFFLSKLTSFGELKRRIRLFENKASEMTKAARTIQLAFAKKLYGKARFINSKIEPYTKPQISSSLLGVSGQFVRSIFNSFEIDIAGPKGQILWEKMLRCREIIKKEGDAYIFMHSHSFPIALHLGLATHFQSMHHSEAFIALKPLANRTMFRARGVAKHFENTDSYFKSSLGKSINAGHTMDDNHRETIISCDGIPNNKEAYESARHFLKSNKSIVDTASSTGMKHANFDRQFIASYLTNPNLQNYAVKKFQKARQQLAELSNYGMLRMIVIPKERIKNSQTNYVWRSHAFGIICRCLHQSKLRGHQEFVATLESHQKNIYNPCKTSKVLQTKLPQYRILAENVDRDPKKQVYTMDCLNESERKRYNDAFKGLESSLTVLVKLEKLPFCKDYASLLELLHQLRWKEHSPDYHAGVKDVLRKFRSHIADYAFQLQRDLSPSLWKYIKNLELFE